MFSSFCFLKKIPHIAFTFTNSCYTFQLFFLNLAPKQPIPHPPESTTRREIQQLNANTKTISSSYIYAHYGRLALHTPKQTWQGNGVTKVQSVRRLLSSKKDSHSYKR
uniref:Uncharacterized protein n=1 Tax=Daucus carota subsp. sativus TaxID=79200 RepID=A0A161ZUC3_DAUCS